MPSLLSDYAIVCMLCRYHEARSGRVGGPRVSNRIPKGERDDRERMRGRDD